MKLLLPCAECSDPAVFRCDGCGCLLCDGCAFRRERERLCEECEEGRGDAERYADLRGDSERFDAAESA